MMGRRVSKSLALPAPLRWTISTFLHDCWCLWLLVTGRAGEVEPEPIRTDWKPTPYVPVALDAWEAEMWANGQGAFWFDPTRYDGTRFAWPERTAVEERQREALVAQRRLSKARQLAFSGTTYGEIGVRVALNE